MNLSFKAASNFLEAYTTPKSVLSMVNVSLLKVVIPSVVAMVAGIVMLLVVFLIV